MAQPIDAELLAAVEDRSSTYGLLARLLGLEVDTELLVALRGLRFPQGTGDALVDEGARLMADWLASATADIEQARTDLAVDFARLFVVRARKDKDAAYPFESVYTSTDRCTMGAARDEVRALYRAAGMEKDGAWRVGEDHIALELEFMQELAARTASALRSGAHGEAEALLADQRAFVDGHLARWVPAFAAAMRRHAKTGFYQGVARFLEGYVLSDRAFLAGVARV